MTMPRSSIRLLIDLQSCQSASRLRGIGRYSSSLARAIAETAGNHEVWLLLSDRFPETIGPIRRAFADLIPSDRIVVFDVPGPIAESKRVSTARMRSAEILREYAIAEVDPDVVFVSSLFEGFVDDATTSIGRLGDGPPTAATLYDLIPKLNPDQYLVDPVFRDYYERKLDWLRRADALLAISESSRAESISCLGVDPGKVTNISAAVDDRFSDRKPEPSAVARLRHRFGIRNEFFVYPPGGFDSRKNIHRLVAAFGQLPPEVRARAQLVIASHGSESEMNRVRGWIREAHLSSSDVVLTGYVDDSELHALYSECIACVLPSLHEGFGLPALEAMACGAAVIGSRTSSLPEAIGRADATFDPTSIESISALMRRVAEEHEFRGELREHGKIHRTKFSWHESARRCWLVFDKLASYRASDAVSRRSNHAGAPASATHYAQLVRSLSLEYSSSPREARVDRAALARCIAGNSAPRFERQLLVDVSELVERDSKTGIQRVVRSISCELLASPPRGFDVRLVHRDRTTNVYRYSNVLQSRFSGRSHEDCREPTIEMRRGDVYLGLDLDLYCADGLTSFLARGRRRGMTVCYVVYDLLLHLRPEFFAEGTPEAFERWLRSISTESDGLIAISDAVRNELRSWLDASNRAESQRPHLDYFHLGADIESSRPSTGMSALELAALAGAKARSTVLMVGTIEPRKGYAQALAAFDELWARGHTINLVIVGKLGWKMESLAQKLRSHPELGRRLHWLDGASDEALLEMYRSSSMLLCASEGEGFGLPLIEAAQRALPVLARDISVFREIGSDAADYFRADSPGELATRIERWFEDFARGSTPDVRTMRWLTWKQSAAALMSAIERVIEEPASSKSKTIRELRVHSRET